MYEKTDKRRLYWIIDMYLAGQIDEPTFCDEYYYSYDLELDRSTLSDEERKVFRELGEIAGRFSEFEEDLKNHPGVYYTKEELKQKIIKSRQNLENYFKEIKSGNNDIKIIQTLRSMLNCEINLVEGCRIIIRLRLGSSLNPDHELFNIFREVASKTDHFQIEAEELKNYTDEFKEAIVASCLNLSQKIQENIDQYCKKINKYATALEDNWLMCPDCIDAWESSSTDPMVICPKCNQTLHNPRYKQENDKLENNDNK